MACMPRHRSFRFCVDLSVEQERVLSRHAGAARFAFNQALRLHKDARVVAHRAQRRASRVLADGDEPRTRTKDDVGGARSEEHTSELQSLMRISYAVFCLKKKKKKP